jgi:hypothetical protein
MTFLGKILIVANLVLSVFVGAFIVMNYVARTNWRNAYEEVAKQARAAQANARVYEQDKLKVQGELDRANKEFEQANQQLKGKEKEFEERLAAARQQYEQQVGTAKGFQGNAQGSAGELDRIHQQLAYEKNLVAQRDTQIRDMEKKNEVDRAARVEAEIAMRSEQERNNQLLTENERLTGELAKREASGAAGAIAQGGRRNPPTEDIEGHIKKVDPSGFVSITVGSDHGLKRGQTLEVYRLTPEPKYIGVIEIIALRPNEAVAKPVGRTVGPIQEGDRVASNILSRR